MQKSFTALKVIHVPDDANLFVGDIHGNYEALMKKLKELNFNFEFDLCISVGDLVDRGKDSLRCAYLPLTSWLEPVKGNHEDFCITGFTDYRTEFYHKQENNGGKWFYELPKEDQEFIASIFNKLPIAIEVHYRGKVYGFVHADMPVQSWELLKEMLANDNDMLDDERKVKQWCLWSREGIRAAKPINIPDIEHVFLGHTVVHNPLTLGNCTFLDTGGVFQEIDPAYKLTVLQIGN